MRVFVYGLAFVLGLTGGLRTFASLFAVRWPYANWTTLASGLLLLGELIADKVPNVPSRTQIGPLVARVVVSGYAAWAFCTPLGASAAGAIVLGALGAIAGAYIGYGWRMKGAPALRLPGWLAALAEDVISVGGALWLVLANR